MTRNPPPRIRLLLCLLLGGLSVAFAQEQRTISVTTTTLESVAFYPQHSAPATTVSLNQSRISAETSGVIEQIPVRVGDRVEQGDLLTALDCRENRLRHEQAEARLASIEARVDLATRQIARTRSLRKTNSASEERLNQQQAELQSARADRRAQRAALAEAALNRDRCRINAPFSGVVQQRLASEGEWVSQGQPLLQLVDLLRLEVSAQVSVDRVTSLQEAENIELEIGSNRYPLTLRTISPLIDPQGRNREVRLLFSDGRALPGSSGRLLWQARHAHVPADLPVRRNEQLGVYLAIDGQARFHPLPQAEEGQPARVELPQRSRLIIEGRQSLRDGDPIQGAD
ncbi:MAG: efflux RND transporter periplasmic adaptor subunit [Sedimenticola sp.]|nr:efflux RND transporter periplasmic adaptor subunit [Sedimenticola sp.]